MLENGQPGGGRDMTGRGGKDSLISVPAGTIVRDSETGEQLGDLSKAGMELLVARGGKGGWGNQRFKSSKNRSPRQYGPGLPGESRELELELKVIADVGLLGLPNAGKSTLISVVSAARPKIADYPFTTLYPNLGVVACGNQRSFVMADIPGLIEGAADGSGLGIRFLKHLQRTRVLLHLVDILPVDPAADPVRDATIHRRRTRQVQRRPAGQAALAGAQQERPAAAGRSHGKGDFDRPGIGLPRSRISHFGRHACWHDGSHRGRHAIPRDLRGAGTRQSAAARGKAGEDPTNPDDTQARPEEGQGGEAQGGQEQGAAQGAPQTKNPALGRVFVLRAIPFF